MMTKFSQNFDICSCFCPRDYHQHYHRASSTTPPSTPEQQQHREQHEQQSSFFLKATVTTARERENKNCDVFARLSRFCFFFSCVSRGVLGESGEKQLKIFLFSGGLKRHPAPPFFFLILFSARETVREVRRVGRRREGTDRREKASSVYLSARKE